ncbi:MAG: O-antigen ligase family protein [Proteobacteria bacterium]|nr:O-antigen ligase family protein [Pseudomonadota bacterium]
MFILILIYLILTIVRPQDYMQALAGIPILPAALVLAFVAWLSSPKKTMAAPQLYLLPVFLLALLMSEVANGWLGGAIEQLRQFSPVVISFFVLVTAVSVRRERVVNTFVVFVLCSMLLALHGIDQFNHGVGWTGMGLSEDRRIQYVGIFNDPNDLGLLFVAVLPMACYLCARAGFLGRLFWLAGVALLLYGIYLTNSRGAFLAVMVIAGVYVWHKRGLFSALVLGTVGMMGLMMLPTRAQDIDVDDPSAFGRVDAWYEGLHMFRTHPLFGVGAGNFTDYNYLTAHNSFVLVLAETGLFGYTLWLAFVGYSFLMMLRILRHSVSLPASQDEPDSEQPDAKTRKVEWERERGLALTLLLSLCGMFAAAFFLSRSYMIVLYLLLAVVVGHFVGVRRRFPEVAGFSLISDGWIWGPLALGSIALLFIVVAVLMRLAA